MANVAIQSQEREKAAPAAERYFNATIAGSPDDMEDVVAVVQGSALYIKRNQRVILPESVVRVFRDAVAPGYTTIDGTTFETPPQPRYLVTELGEAPAAEFQRMLAEKKVISRLPMPRVSSVVRRIQQAMATTNL